MSWDKAARLRYKRKDNYMQYDLTDNEWAAIEPLLPQQGRMGRPRNTFLRRVFDAIRHRLAAGCQWRMLPSCHPPFSTVRNCFHRLFRGRCVDTHAGLFAGSGPSPCRPFVGTDCSDHWQSGVKPSGSSAGSSPKGSGLAALKGRMCLMSCRKARSFCLTFSR